MHPVHRALRLFTALALFIAAGAASAQHKPAIWIISDDDTTVYLLGTIHLLKPDTPWYTDELRRIMAAAESLTVEAEVDAIDPMQMQQLVMRVGYYPQGRSLSDDLSGDVMTQVRDMAGRAGLPAAALERMKPWLVGVTLTAQLSAQAGFLPQYGVDATLIADARAAEMTVRPLESIEEQLGLFSDMPMAAQVQFLKDGLDELDDIDSFFEQLKTAWLEADLATIEDMLAEGLTENEALAQAMLYDRNAAWLPRIAALLDESGVHLVAVGAGHLIGEDSVIDMLAEAGHEVARH